MKAQFKFLSGARAGQVEAFRKGYIGLGRHPLSDVRFDAERDLDVSSRHAAIVRKTEGFVLQDLGSRNGTFVNRKQISGDTLLKDGDVIAFGANGPALEFHVVDSETDVAPGLGSAENLAERASSPREIYQAVQRPTAPRQSTGVRIAAEVARQTAQLRRTTKVLIVLLLVVGTGFTWMQLDGRRRAGDLATLQARADSLMAESRDLTTRFRTELQGVRDALKASQDETTRLRRELASSGGDAASVARLRVQLDDAERRQRALAGAVGGGVDYRAISHQNQDAVAIVLVEYTDGQRFSGTAFAVDSNGTMVTNKHILVGEEGDKTPRRLGVIFSGSTQFWRADMIGVSPETDLGVIRVTIKGGTPRVRGLARTREGIERGDPVAILGYPLGFDLPMENRGGNPIAEPTLTVGTVSKALTSVTQVDAYGAPGSSGSPIFDRNGNVIAVLYGGERESNGKIIFAVPAYIAVDYLKSLNLTR